MIPVYVGGYTQDLGRIKGTAQGVACYMLDLSTGQMRLHAEHASDNPSFLSVHPNGKFIYATNEYTAFGAQPTDCALSAFAISPNKALSLLNQQASLGTAPCFVSVEPQGKFVFTANYFGGNFVVYPLAADGRLLPAYTILKPHPSPPTAPESLVAHPHAIQVTPDGRHLLACDLGLDTIFIYRFDVAQGKLELHGQVIFPTGSGPRHFSFHPNQRYLYVVSEKANSLTAFAWHHNTGQLIEIQAAATLPAGITEPSWGAEVHVHPNGQFVYVSNRGHDSLAIYQLELSSGKFTLLGHEPTRGQWPRNFALTPQGELLLVAHQDSNTVVVFRVETTTGRLQYLTTNAVPTPVCLKFN